MSASVQVTYFSIPGYGYGHVSRSNALIKQLSEKNGFRVCARQIIGLSEEGADPIWDASCSHSAHDVEVIDSPLPMDNLLNEMAKRGSKTVVFDHRGSLVPDLMITADLSQEFTPGRRSLRGLEYAIIRPELRRTGKARRTQEEYSLVVIGGEDPRGLSEKISRQVSRLGKETRVALGPMNSGTFRKAAGIRSYENHEGFSELMRGARRAFSSGGTVLLEILHNGVPAFVIPQTVPEHDLARKLHAKGLIMGIGVPSTAICRASEQLCSLRAARAIDGRGLERIAREITGLSNGE